MLYGNLVSLFSFSTHTRSDEVPLSEASYAIRKPIYIDSSSKVLIIDSIITIFEFEASSMCVSACVINPLGTDHSDRLLMY